MLCLYLYVGMMIGAAQHGPCVDSRCVQLDRHLVRGEAYPPGTWGRLADGRLCLMRHQ
jgi:hypothetical protein